MIGLEGIKVVDLTAYVAAPACPRILGEMGATVYKVEPFVGDEQRTQGASWGMKSKTRGYGERGPERDSKGFDATSYSSRGGLVMAFPQKGEHFEPANVPVAFGDWNASVALTAGILAALVRRLRCGKGDKVVVNLYHCAIWGMSSAVAVSQQGGEYPRSRKEVPCPTNNC